NPPQMMEKPSRFHPLRPPPGPGGGSAGAANAGFLFSRYPIAATKPRRMADFFRPGKTFAAWPFRNAQPADPCATADESESFVSANHPDPSASANFVDFTQTAQFVVDSSFLQLYYLE